MNDNRRARSVMEDAIAAVNWGSWTQPPGNSQQTVPNEIRKILSASGEESSWEAVTRTERACGDSGPGTYYPVALPAISILALIVQNGEEWPSLTAVEILTDWLFSFHPYSKHREIRGMNGNSIDLQGEVNAEILKLRPIFESMMERDDIADSKKGWIREALAGMDEI